jgi:F420-dependent oxidoreductase-like protein
MKIGITIGDVRGPAALGEIVGQAQAAAEAGIDAVWSAQAPGWDALTLLALVGAQVPEIISVGSAVVPIPQRHPLVLAGQALSTQAAVDGRLTLGIGVGIAAMVTGMFGLPTDRPVARMREYLSVLRPLLGGESVQHNGTTLTAVGSVNVTGATAPPVLLAALGPAMLRLAGESAEGAITWMTGPKTLREHIVPTITAAAMAAGRPAPRIVAGLPVCVTIDEESVRARIAQQFGMAGQVPEYRAMLDREQVEGPQHVAIVGDEKAVAQAILRLADAGITELMASPFGTHTEQNLTIQVLADLASASRTAHPDDAIRQAPR